MPGFSPVGSRPLGSVPYGISPGPSGAYKGATDRTRLAALQVVTSDYNTYQRSTRHTTKFAQGYTKTPGGSFALANRRGRYIELLPLPKLDEANVKRHTNFRAPHGMFVSKLNEYTAIVPSKLNASKILEYVIIRPKYRFKPRRMWDPRPEFVRHHSGIPYLTPYRPFRLRPQRLRTPTTESFLLPHRRAGSYIVLDDGTITIIWS